MRVCFGLGIVGKVGMNEVSFFFVRRVRERAEIGVYKIFWINIEIEGYGNFVI